MCTASLAASVMAMYSASVEDKTTVRFLRDSHVIAAPLRMNTDPVYDRRSMVQLAQLASTKPLLRGTTVELAEHTDRIGDVGTSS